MQRTITEMFNFKRKEQIEESEKENICRRNEEFEQLEEEDSDEVSAGPSTGNNNNNDNDNVNDN